MAVKSNIKAFNSSLKQGISQISNIMETISPEVFDILSKEVEIIMKQPRSHPKGRGVSNKVASGDFLNSLNIRNAGNGRLIFYSSDPDALDIDSTEDETFVVRPGEASISQLIPDMERWIRDKGIDGEISAYQAAKSVSERGIFNERIFIRALAKSEQPIVAIMDKELQSILNKI